VSSRSPKKVPSPPLEPPSPLQPWWILAAALLAFGGCGPSGPDRPRWIDLAAGFRPRPLQDLARSWTLALAPEERPDVRLHDDGESVWLERTLPRASWAKGEAPGTWSTPRPRSGGFEHFPEGHTRLVAGATEFKRFTGEGTPGPGSFATAPDRITLVLGPTKEPPERAVFGVRASSGASFGDTWHVRRRDCSGSGVPVWGGEREQIVIDVPRRSALRVTTSCSDPAVGRDPDRKPRFRVRLDDALILDVQPSSSWTHHRVLLPPEGRERTRFTFEMDGTGLGLFLAPTIGPAECGQSGSRPWGEERPDLVVFLADTFRADNLSAWGGRADLAPNLDALALRSRRFLEARAAASWTLPSISSLLTGVYPPQHGATDEDLSLSRDLSTVAEFFQRAGYRTGAVTDAAFFSQAFGLEQGFDWFVEFPVPEWNLDRTIDEALAFLERDDGRPVFLVLHTYRVHGPYRQGPDEDPGAWNALYAEGLKQFTAEERREPDLATTIYLSLAERFRALYHGAVRDLDHEFGRFFGELERRDALAQGVLVFTSDHGEAFGENGDVWHGRDLWDTKLRVPLFVFGPGVVPGDDSSSASLVDLAPTLAAFANLTPDPAWEGVPLVMPPGEHPPPLGEPSPFHDRRERTLFAFQLVKGQKEIAIVDRGHKVFADPDADVLAVGDFRRAFDLAVDPGEEHGLDADAGWPGTLCREKAEAVRRLLVPMAALSEASAGSDAAAQIRALGYGGGEKKP